MTEATSTPAGSDQAGFFHAVALDYDGTLTDTGHLDGAVLAALAATRAAGRKVVLVTGRMLSELRTVFPEVDTSVDMVVAENGAVLAYQYMEQLLAGPVPRELDHALTARGVGFQRGRAILACQGADERAVSEAVRELGLECQLVRNRAALMVLPAGVSKGTGLFEALGYLGVSHHNTVAVGDAENDHSLLAAAEVGVAVANAVDSLKADADIVLAHPDGRGVAALLDGPVMTGQRRLHPVRWQIALGTDPDGHKVSLPASQLNVLVTGSPRRGKSYVAGLIAEQLIGLRYSVLVLDPEGDHSLLGHLRGVLVVGADGRLPPPTDLMRLIAHRFSSVVVDLSIVSASDRDAYLRDLPAAIEAERQRSGLPHWVIVDEAQDPLGRHGVANTFLEPASRGYCLVTYRPDELCAEALLAIDALVAVPGGRDLETTAGLVAVTGSISRARGRELIRSAGPGQAVLVQRTTPGRSQVFTIAARGTGHLRHWHKYAEGGLPIDRWFYFRLDADTPSGTVAGNLEQFDRQLRSCPASVISHHCSHGDFSRWVGEVLGDPPLASDLGEVETEFQSGAISDVEARRRLLRAIEARHPDQRSGVAGHAAGF